MSTRPTMEAVEKALEIVQRAAAEIQGGPQRSEDLREALRIAHAAGADLQIVRLFWRVAGIDVTDQERTSWKRYVARNELYAMWRTLERTTGLVRWQTERRQARIIAQLAAGYSIWDCDKPG
jgi:hypothetical protein